MSSVISDFAYCSVAATHRVKAITFLAYGNWCTNVLRFVEGNLEYQFAVPHRNESCLAISYAALNARTVLAAVSSTRDELRPTGQLELRSFDPTGGAHLLGKNVTFGCDLGVSGCRCTGMEAYVTREQAGRIVDAATRLAVLADQLQEAHGAPGYPAGDMARLEASFDQAMARLASLGPRGA